MKEVVYWIADDGKRFYDKDECINHELYLKRNKYADDLKLYDINADPLLIDLEKDDGGLGAIYFINIKTQEALNYFRLINDTLCNYSAFYDIISPGKYFFPLGGDSLYSVEDENYNGYIGFYCDDVNTLFEYTKALEKFINMED